MFQQWQVLPKDLDSLQRRRQNVNYIIQHFVDRKQFNKLIRDYMFIVDKVFLFLVLSVKWIIVMYFYSFLTHKYTHLYSIWTFTNLFECAPKASRRSKSLPAQKKIVFICLIENFRIILLHQKCMNSICQRFFISF